MAASKYHLVIVESPAKAKTIKRFLGARYHVEASMGHVRDLPKSQMGIDVENDFEPKYITIRGKGELLDRIRSQAQGASKVYLATDPDREGEAISWHLAHVLKLAPDAICRIEFHEITKSAVTAAIKKARPVNLQLVDAQQARRVLDRLVGYQISPLLWRKVRKGLSAGRVQSVATRIICDRESEIDAFESREFWTLHAGFTLKSKRFEARCFGPEGECEFPDEASAQALSERLMSGGFRVGQIRRGERRKNAPAPFTTSSLQQEASRKLGFTTRKTMLIAQQLYEGIDIKGEGTVGLISYIRTDSVRLSDEALQMARDYIAAQFGPEYLPESPVAYKGRKGAQDAHEAIRTTAMRHPDSVKDSLNRDQYRLYKMIFERFVACQMTPAVFETMAVQIEPVAAIERFSLRANGSHLRFKGFMSMYIEGRDGDEEDGDKDISLPALTEGQELPAPEMEKRQHFTQPPPRYTEASLVRALEEKGIGRPSTYAPIISTILTRGYVERDGKALLPTELGEIVTDLMKDYFKDVVDVAFTAGMEEELDQVEAGKLEWRKVIRDFYGPFHETLEKADAQIEKVELQDEASDIPCEKCGAMMVYKMGRFGRFLACPRYPECKNTKPIVETLPDVVCPKCGKPITQRRTKKGGRTFYGCTGYPECDYISWERPVAQKCPACGGDMVRKQDRRGNVWNQCVNAECGQKVTVEES